MEKYLIGFDLSRLHAEFVESNILDEFISEREFISNIYYGLKLAGYDYISTLDHKLRIDLNEGNSFSKVICTIMNIIAIDYDVKRGFNDERLHTHQEVFDLIVDALIINLYYSYTYESTRVYSLLKLSNTGQVVSVPTLSENMNMSELMSQLANYDESLFVKLMIDIGLIKQYVDSRYINNHNHILSTTDTRTLAVFDITNATQYANSFMGQVSKAGFGYKPDCSDTTSLTYERYMQQIVTALIDAIKDTEIEAYIRTDNSTNYRPGVKLITSVYHMKDLVRVMINKSRELLLDKSMNGIYDSAFIDILDRILCKGCIYPFTNIRDKQVYCHSLVDIFDMNHVYEFSTTSNYVTKIFLQEDMSDTIRNIKIKFTIADSEKHDEKALFLYMSELIQETNRVYQSEQSGINPKFNTVYEYDDAKLVTIEIGVRNLFDVLHLCSEMEKNKDDLGSLIFSYFQTGSIQFDIHFRLSRITDFKPVPNQPETFKRYIMKSSEIKGYIDIITFVPIIPTICQTEFMCSLSEERYLQQLTQLIMMNQVNEIIKNSLFKNDKE